MARWDYGDSWEAFPIVEGEVWGHRGSGSMVSVCDLRDGLPGYMSQADMVYCDPPWSKGNANAFVTKAGKDRYVADFGVFASQLFAGIVAIAPTVCYLEIGKQHLADFARRLSGLFPATRFWPITYYRKHPCFLLRGGPGPVGADFAGMDDEDTPLAAIQAERATGVADMCMGRGTTMLAVHAYGGAFYGTELNRRRLAVAIDRAAKLGFPYGRVGVALSLGPNSRG